MTTTPNTESVTPDPTKGKGKAFFDRADQVAETGSWDFAIELYLEGLLREPGALDRGHTPLWKAALQRKAKGGKPAGFFEKNKYKSGKDAVSQMVAAEYLLSKDPGNEVHMEQFFKAAKAAELPDVTKWMLDMLVESQRQKTVKARNKRLLQEITKGFDELKNYDQAILACALLLEINRNDNFVQEVLKDLQTQRTIQQGGYGDKNTSFTKGVKDIQAQLDASERDELSQSEDFKLREIEKKKTEYLEASTVPGKINAYADALIAMAEEGYENEAVDVLLKAYRETNSYQYRMRVGEVRMRQAKRRVHKAKESGDKAAHKEALQAQVQLELEEFTERAANYPTDLSIKYELGRRQYALGQYDAAIGSLQQARRDARHAVRANVMLAKAFEKKGMHDREAADTLEETLKGQLLEDQEKEIRYLLGTLYVKMGQFQQAEQHLSRVTQIDYNYEDARTRLEQIRAKMG